MRGMTAPKPQRRTIRFAIAAVVCLLLGAVTTVGVAWWLCDPDRGWGFSYNGQSPEKGRWYRVRDDVRCGVRWVTDWRLEPEEVRTETEAGWPWRAVESVAIDRLDQPPSLKYSASWREGIRLTTHGASRPRGPALPVLPLFPGFALDTALYAAAWYLLIFTPLPLIRAGRRRFRVSRGMCGSCGYDLNASTNRPCPECGA